MARLEANPNHVSRLVASRVFGSVVFVCALTARTHAAPEAASATTTPTTSTTPEPLTLSGYLQLDWVIHDQTSRNEVNHSTNMPLNQERILLRRGRLRAETTSRSVGAILELDANTVSGLQLRPMHAEIHYRWPPSPDPWWPEIIASGGLIKMPFGFEVSERELERPFLERSTATQALFPGFYDLGLQLRVSYRFLNLVVAVMNGHPVGDRVFPAMTPTDTREIVGRLGTRAELGAAVVLECGVSADGGKGFHPGTATTKDTLVWRDDNGDGLVAATEVQVVAGTSGTASQTYDRFAVGADARLSIHFTPQTALRLRSEVVRAQNLDRGLELGDPIAAGYDLREFGYHVGLSQDITRYGMLGVRYDAYDPDQDARELRADDVLIVDRTYRALAFLAAFRIDAAQLRLEYTKNWNALGRTPSGSPTTLQSDSWVLRAEAKF